MGCDDGQDGIEGCHGVLVLHADGTLECDGFDRCGGDGLVHEWEITCVELTCGCMGDEHELGAWEELAMAA